MVNLHPETFATVLKMRFFLSTVPPARNGRGAGKPAYEVLDENGQLLGRGRTEDDAILKSFNKAKRLIEDASK